MTQYPLLFTFRQKVEGNDNYLADVTIYGRLLADGGDGEMWLYGVNPGAIAARGETLTAAYAEFKETLTKVLYDFAAEAPNYHSFLETATRFFNETDEETVAEWNAAREQVRRGELDIKGMRREKSETPWWIEITRKQVFTPKGNLVDSQLAMAA